VELEDGSYTRIIHNSCKVLADAINLGQQGIHRAKTEVDEKLDKMRQVIHEKTAPKKSPASPAPEAKPPATPAAEASAPSCPAEQTNSAAANPPPASATSAAEVEPAPPAKAPRKAAPRRKKKSATE
jgi:hypothetical protein